jgi:hypothetical protein
MPSDQTAGSARHGNAPKPEAWFGVALGFLAAILLLDTIATAFVLPQAPGRAAEPSTGLIPQLALWRLVVSLPLPVPRQPHQLAITLLATTALKFAAYALAVFLAWRRADSRRYVLFVAGAAALFFLVSACALPNVNRDIYNYILSGRVAAVHGANPYEVAPDRFPDDPIYPYASPRYTSYPGDNKFPAWMILNVALAALGGNHPVANLLLYRGAFLLFNIANLALLAWILRTVQPKWALAGMVLYAWNPIVITHAQSKVDTVMVFFVFLSALALVRGRREAAIAVLGISSLVKLIALPLAAVCWLAELRARRWRALAIATLLLGLSTVALYAPFWHGLGVLDLQLRLLGNVRASGPELFQRIVYAGFAGAVLWIGLTRDGRVEHMLRGWALLMLLFALFLSRLGFSWYLITVIGVASLAADWRIAMVTVLLSSVAYLMNAWDTASNETFDLPTLFALPRFPTYLLLVWLVAIGITVLEVARRIRQRHGAEYQLERR